MLGKGAVAAAAGEADKPKDGDAEKPADADKPKDGEKPAEGEKPKDGEKPAEGDKPADDPPIDKPEAYADWKLPEGAQLDKELDGKFRALAATHKLPQAAAQAFVDLHSNELVKLASAAVERQQQVFDDRQREWIKAVKADPEIGGKNYDLNRVLFVKGMEAIAGDGEAGKQWLGGLIDALEFTGAGNQPSIIQAFTRLIKAANLVEGNHVGGKPPAPTMSRAESLYPTMRPKT